LQPLAQPGDVGALSGEQLAGVTKIQPGAADNVRHEGITSHEVAPGDGDCEGVKVCGVAVMCVTLPELVLDRPDHTATGFARRPVRLIGKAATPSELAQQFQQLKIRPGKRLPLVDSGFEDPHGPSIDGLAQYGLELAEGGFVLRDAAQIVLIEIERQRIVSADAA